VINAALERCVGCGGCVSICPVSALKLKSNVISVSERCVNCGACVDACPYGVFYQNEPLEFHEIRRIEDDYDVIVIGGGPAGSTAARFAAQNGAKVLILERKPIVGVPQLCAEGISTTGLTDVIPEVKDNWVAAPIEGAILVSPAGNRIKVEHREAGFVLERRVFDRDLFAMAGNAGARTLVSASVESLNWEHDHVVGVKYNHRGQRKEVRAKIIIAADGVESNVVRWLFPEKYLDSKTIHVAAQVVMAGVDVEVGYVEFYLGRKIAPGGYAWVFPKGDHFANVGLGINPSLATSEKTSVWNLLENFVESRFGSKGEIIEMAGGNVPTSLRLPRIAYRNILFCGDCARVTDPISGGGIATALLSGKLAGELAAKSLHNKTPEQIENSLGDYNSIWDKAKGKQMAFYARAKDVFSRLPNKELEEICDFIDERFSNRVFTGIDIPGTLKSILRRRSLLWQLFKALLPHGD